MMVYTPKQKSGEGMIKGEGKHREKARRRGRLKGVKARECEMFANELKLSYFPHFFPYASHTRRPVARKPETYLSVFGLFTYLFQIALTTAEIK